VKICPEVWMLVLESGKSRLSENLGKINFLQL